MAQIEPTEKGKKKKGAQKKMAIHVDFTPMVDMNMLLITFFMLCTTMIQSRTMQIILPSNDKNIKEEQKTQADASEAITLILDTEYDSHNLPLKDANGNPQVVPGNPVIDSLAISKAILPEASSTPRPNACNPPCQRGSIYSPATQQA